MNFGLAAQRDILEAVQQPQCKTSVLIGYETDVCVAHSALGLQDLGYRVVCVEGATGSLAMRTKSESNGFAKQVGSS